MAESIEFQSLAEAFRGRLIPPSDDAYDGARQIYNAMIDKRPALIAQCVDTADVMAAVRFSQERKLLVSVRGGGHNGPGLSLCDDGLVVDLSGMKGVRVDPQARTVRVGAGCTQGDVDHATQPFELAVPSGLISTTGIAGLTLGGGHGYLSRKYGLTIDNLIEADVVLADGTCVTASETQNTDLFWALRGGGGNFGIVTSFLFRGQPVSEVFAGPMFWDLKDAREVMQWYREFLPSAPRDAYAFCGLKTVPPAPAFPEEIHHRKICAIFWSYDGPQDEAENVMASVRDLPPPIFEHVGCMPLTTLQGIFDPLLPPGLQWYWKGDFVDALPDESIDRHLEFAENTPSTLSLMHLYPIDGAVHDVGATDTAWSYRDVTWSMVIAGVDPDPQNAERISAWAKDYWSAVHPHSAGGAYVNFLMDEGEDRVRSTYGPNYERLAAVKAEYDPDNFFRVNQNIRPRN